MRSICNTIDAKKKPLNMEMMRCVNVSATTFIKPFTIIPDYQYWHEMPTIM